MDSPQVMDRARLRTMLTLGLGVAILGVLVWMAGPREVVRAFGQASPIYLALAALSYALFFILRGLRWKMLFAQSAPDVRMSTTTGATAIGWLANSILPLKGGELLRAALLARRDRVSLVTSGTTVALERVLDLLGLAIVAALGLLIIPRATALPAWLMTALEVAWILPIACIVILGVLVMLRERVLATASRALEPLGRFGRKVHGLLTTVLGGFAALAARPRLLLMRLAPLTILIALSQALIFAALVRAFIPAAGWGLAFAGSSVFLLSFVISITPGNVGTYEAAFVAVFVALGVPADVAVPASILTHLTTTLLVAIAGSIALFSLGFESQGTWRPIRVAPSQGGFP